MFKNKKMIKIPKVPVSKLKVCEARLSWILNMRQALRIDPKLAKKENHNELEKKVREDGHSGYSFYWTLHHAQRLEQMGFKKWLKNLEGEEMI